MNVGFLKVGLAKFFWLTSKKQYSNVQCKGERSKQLHYCCIAIGSLTAYELRILKTTNDSIDYISRTKFLTSTSRLSSTQILEWRLFHFKYSKPIASRVGLTLKIWPTSRTV